MGVLSVTGNMEREKSGDQVRVLESAVKEALMCLVTSLPNCSSRNLCDFDTFLTSSICNVYVRRCKSASLSARNALLYTTPLDMHRAFPAMSSNYPSLSRALPNFCTVLLLLYESTFCILD